MRKGIDRSYTRRYKRRYKRLFVSKLKTLGGKRALDISQGYKQISKYIDAI